MLHRIHLIEIPKVEPFGDLFFRSPSIIKINWNRNQHQSEGHQLTVKAIPKLTENNISL